MSVPSATPSKVPDIISTRRVSVAPYHSRRLLPAVPRVRTPRRSTRATGSVTVHQAGDSATRAGTALSATPSHVRSPTVRSRCSDVERTCQRGPSSTTLNGSIRVSSKW